MQKIFLSLVLVALGLSASILAKPLNPKKVVYAIDCGGFTSTKSSLGFIYNKDEGFTESRVSDYNNNEELQKVLVQYTNDQSVYKTERHHDDSFGYDVPLATNGKYVLILKFSEMYFKEAGKRVFNVKLGDRVVVQDLDIVAKVGPFAAYDEYIEFELRDDQIYFNGEVCPKAYKAKAQKLVFELEKGKRDLPKMEAFLVYEGTLSDTDFFEQDQVRSEWKSRIEEEKRIQEEERKQRSLAKKKLMENLGKGALEFEDNQETIFQGIFRVFRQKEGLAIFGTLLSCLVLLFLFGRDPKNV